MPRNIPFSLKERRFIPGETVFHVQHGRIILSALKPSEYGSHADGTVVVDRGPMHGSAKEYLHQDGRLYAGDALPRIFSLDQAREFGWLPPEPVRIEYTQRIPHSAFPDDHLELRDPAIRKLTGKKVRITVEEIPE